MPGQWRGPLGPGAGAEGPRRSGSGAEPGTMRVRRLEHRRRAARCVPMREGNSGKGEQPGRAAN